MLRLKVLLPKKRYKNEPVNENKEKNTLPNVLKEVKINRSDVYDYSNVRPVSSNKDKNYAKNNQKDKIAERITEQKVIVNQKIERKESENSKIILE